MYNEQTIAFWNSAHENTQRPEIRLTGNHLVNYLDYFLLHDIYKKASFILELGVGLGYAVQEMSNDKKEVYGVDISKVSLQKVSNYLVNSWSPEEYQKIPSNMFDLVISKALSIHLTDRELEDQITQIIRILKPTGVFAFEFYDRPNYNGLRSYTEGTMYRPFSFVEYLIEKNKGKISLLIKRLNENPSPLIIEYGLQIKKIP